MSSSEFETEKYKSYLVKAARNIAQQHSIDTTNLNETSVASLPKPTLAAVIQEAGRLYNEEKSLEDELKQLQQDLADVSAPRGSDAAASRGVTEAAPGPTVVTNADAGAHADEHSDAAQAAALKFVQRGLDEVAAPAQITESDTEAEVLSKAATVTQSPDDFKDDSDFFVDKARRTNESPSTGSSSSSSTSTSSSFSSTPSGLAAGFPDKYGAETGNTTQDSEDTVYTGNSYDDDHDEVEAAAAAAAAAAAHLQLSLQPRSEAHATKKGNQQQVDSDTDEEDEDDESYDSFASTTVPAAEEDEEEEEHQEADDAVLVASGPRAIPFVDYAVPETQMSTVSQLLRHGGRLSVAYEKLLNNLLNMRPGS